MSVLPFSTQLRDDVKLALSDPRRVCDLLGLSDGSKPQAGGISVCCPSHKENVPSCSVTVGPDGTLRVRCFACDFTGDVFHLVAAVHDLNVTRDFAAVLGRAAELAGISTERPMRGAQARVHARTAPTPVPAPAESLDALWGALGDLSADAWEYLNGRGLADAASECRGLQGDERTEVFARSGYALAMPMRDAAGRVVAVQMRNMAEKCEQDDRFRVVGPSSAGVFGDPLAVKNARNVIVAEGMTDTLAATLAARGGKVTVAVGIAGVKATAGLLTLPLQGKNVLLAHDADAAGDQAARTLSEQLRRLGAVPVRARPTTEGADLASMHRAGINLVEFFRSALARAAGFGTARDHLSGERQGRLAIAPKIISFGIRFLDVALGGLFPDDVVLLGGVSGIGKTEAARIIAQHNAENGKSVHYFALEASQFEIERRAKYSLIAKAILAKHGQYGPYERLNYLEWSTGQLDELTGPFEDEAEQTVVEKCKNLHTSYPDDFTVADLEKAVAKIHDETDLVVIDHFHFLDFGEYENRAAKDAMKRIRVLARRYQKPILLVAHIRKDNAGRKRLIPVLDDFHGSSDIPKMATKAVLIAPAIDRQDGTNHFQRETYISVGKCRQEGARARFAACVEFDFRSRSYSDRYQLGTVTSSGEKFIQITDTSQWPRWARADAPKPTKPDWRAEKDD